MYGESQFPLVCKIRVSSLRYALRNCSVEMPFIFDDIYFHILRIFEAEFEEEKSKPLITIPDSIISQRTDLNKCIEYDLPYQEYPGNKTWRNRKYGLPRTVSIRFIVWEKSYAEFIVIDIVDKKISHMKQGHKTIVRSIDELPAFQIDFFYRKKNE